MSEPIQDRAETIRRAKSAFAVVLSFAIIISVIVVASKLISDKWYEYRTADDYLGMGAEEVEVVIPKGASIGEIGQILVKQDVVKSVKAFRQAAVKNPQANSLSYGKYRLHKQMEAKLAVEALLNPDNRVRVFVTLPEGLTSSQQSAIIASKTSITAESLEKVRKNPKDLNLPDWAENNVEGVLFPETYEVEDETTATSLLARQVQQFKLVANEVGLNNATERVGYSTPQVLVVASLIEREVNQEEYRPMVAAVIYNRLKAGMMLQFDSTVHYANGTMGDGRVTTTAEERKIDSPFNTYKVKGLPPSPICNPGRSAMSAALNPAQSDALYFTTVNLDTGETKFAKTNEEHNVNVAEFQQWCQANPGRC